MQAHRQDKVGSADDTHDLFRRIARIKDIRLVLHEPRHIVAHEDVVRRLHGDQDDISVIGLDNVVAQRRELSLKRAEGAPVAHRNADVGAVGWDAASPRSPAACSADMPLSVNTGSAVRGCRSA